MEFKEFYLTNYKKLYHYFHFRFATKEEIEDLTHEVFARFLKKYYKQNPEQTQATKVLFGIAKNVYKEWVRKKVKNKEISFLDYYDYEFANKGLSIANIEFDSNKKNLIIKIKECLPFLKERVRNVIDLRFFKKKTRSEIAKKLGISEDDVHTYQKRGIKYLSKIISKNENKNS